MDRGGDDEGEIVRGRGGELEGGDDMEDEVGGQRCGLERSPESGFES